MGVVMIYDFDENILIRKSQLKSDIKETAGKCSMILLFLSVSTYFGGSIILRMLKIIGMGSGGYLNIASDTESILGISKDAYNFWIGYFPCILADILAITFCIFTFKKGIKTYFTLKKEVSSSFILSGAFASIGVGIISSIIFLIYSMIFNSQGIDIPSPDFSIPKDGVYLVLFFAYTCIIAPVFEEIIFRGFILNNMRRFGNITAILVTSVFFSMFHFNLVQLVNPILMGIILSFIAIRSESIISCIIVHMFNNIMAMLTTVISYIDSQAVILIWSSLYYLIGIAALFYFIFKYGGEFLKAVKEQNTVLKVRKKLLYSFSNKWALMYILFYIFVVTITMAAKNI